MVLWPNIFRKQWVNIFLELFLLDHLMDLVLLRLHVEIVQLNISKRTSSDGVWLWDVLLELLRVISFEEMVFHRWLSATFIWQIHWLCLPVGHTGNPRIVLWISSLHCQRNPFFPYLERSKIKLFCIKQGSCHCHLKLLAILFPSSKSQFTVYEITKNSWIITKINGS